MNDVINEQTIFTAKTVTVNKFVKRTPYSGLDSEGIDSAEHGMDVLIFRKGFLDLLLDQLMNETIVEKIESVILNLAFVNNVRVVDASSYCNRDHYL